MRPPGTPMNGPYQPHYQGGGRFNWMSALVGFAIGLVLATFAWVTVLPQNGGGGDQGEFVFVPPDQVPEEIADAASGEEGASSRTVTRQEVVGDSGTAGDAAGPGGVALSGAGGPGGAGPGGAGGTGGDGSGGGGGSTTGVTDDRILLGATVAEDGIAKDFLGEVRLGMEAVRSRVNGAGGVHGRQLEVIYRDDAWDPVRGRSHIENLIREQGVFALSVSPSSEGLNSASEAGLFRNNAVPVVGADGLNNTQFLDPWIWPVAAATTTQMHVILKEAYDRCRSTDGCDELRPAIVFGSTYRFGFEGAYAFNGAFCRASGGSFSDQGQCSGGDNIPGYEPGGKTCRQGSRFCGIDATKQQFPSEISTVRDACRNESVGGGKCNFILLLLEPATALSWMGGFDAATEFETDGGCCGMAGAQPLFTSNFATECGSKCNRMIVWTGYNPPCCYSTDPVATYVRELKRQSSGADEHNQFTMGGYIGMTLLVEALERVGPDLTREGLVETLNSMPPLQTGLTNSDGLRWTADRRYANDSAQGFRIDFSDRFGGWQRHSQYVPDDWLGQDNRVP